MSDHDELARVTRIRELYYKVFSSVEGREVLEDIVRKGSVLLPIGSHLAEYSALHEGKRWLALTILNLAIPDISKKICALDPTYYSNPILHPQLPEVPSLVEIPHQPPIGEPVSPTSIKPTRRSKTSRPSQT